MMSNRSKIRTPEERSKKMIKEEKTIVDLELAVKKEKFKKKADPDKESKTDT